MIDQRDRKEETAGPDGVTTAVQEDDKGKCQYRTTEQEHGIDKGLNRRLNVVYPALQGRISVDWVGVWQVQTIGLIIWREKKIRLVYKYCIYSWNR